MDRQTNHQLKFIVDANYGRSERILSKEIEKLFQDQADFYEETMDSFDDERTTYYQRRNFEEQNADQIAALLKKQYPTAFRFFVVKAETPVFRPKLWVTEEWKDINLRGKEPEQRTTAKYVEQLGLKQDDLVIFLSGERATYQDKPCSHVVLFMYSDIYATAIPSPRDDAELPSAMKTALFQNFSLTWDSLSVLYPGSSSYLTVKDHF